MRSSIMCGFFAFSTGLSSREIADLLHVTNLPRSLKYIESLKFYPKSEIPTISKNSPNQLVLRYWSLIPRWWKQELSDLKFSTFNARAEDITHKATYKYPWANSQRCLVPATWFYEFESRKLKGQNKLIKVPYRVEVVDEPVITMAGLYETWTDPQGSKLESVTLITSDASPTLKPIHARQPVIIKPADREKWLSKQVAPAEALPLLQSRDTFTYVQIDQDFNRSFGEDVTPDMVSRYESID